MARRIVEGNVIAIAEPRPGTDIEGRKDWRRKGGHFEKAIDLIELCERNVMMTRRLVKSLWISNDQLCHVVTKAKVYLAHEDKVLSVQPAVQPGFRKESEYRVIDQSPERKAVAAHMMRARAGRRVYAELKNATELFHQYREHLPKDFRDDARQLDVVTGALLDAEALINDACRRAGIDPSRERRRLHEKELPPLNPSPPPLPGIASVEGDGRWQCAACAGESTEQFWHCPCCAAHNAATVTRCAGACGGRGANPTELANLGRIG